MDQLSHIDDEGRVKMVDTSGKAATTRNAVASARVLMSKETVNAVQGHRTPKGDPLEAARLAGIMAAKRTAELIPLCHPLPLTHVDVQAQIKSYGIRLESSVSTNAQTGVEMEALMAVSIAALTIYDMCKALDKGITISDVRLERKTGGKSGDYHNSIVSNGDLDMKFAISRDARPQVSLLLTAALISIALWFVPFAEIL